MSVSRELDRKAIIILSILLFVGIIYLSYGITHEGLWIDEAFTATIVKMPLSKIWTTIGLHDVHPPLYYLLLRLHVLIFGYSDFALRLFSVFGAFAFALLGIGPVRRAYGTHAGILYIFIVLVTPVTLVYAQDARMYIWAAFFVTGCLLYAYLAVMQGQQSDWLKLALFSVAAIYTHYYALLAVVIMYVLLFAWLFIKRKKLIFKYLLTAGFVIVCYIPWILKLLQQTSYVVKDFWITNVTAATLLQTFLYPYSYQFGSPQRPISSDIAFGILVLLTLFGIFRALAKKKTDLVVTIFSLSVFILTILSGFLISVAVRPILVPRYMMPVLGLFLLPVAYGLSQIGKRAHLVSICTIVIAFSLPQIIKIHTQQFKGPMKDVSKYIAADMKPDDVFLQTHIIEAITFSCYFPNQIHFFFDPQDTRNHQHDVFSNMVVGPDVNTFLNGHKNVWLIGREKTPGNLINRYWVATGQVHIIDGTKKFKHIELSWVTSPDPDGKYNLSLPINRAQVATSIVTKKYGENYSYSTIPHFTDVSDKHPAFKYIQKMYEERITSGYADGTFRPAGYVNRSQMAAFIIRAKFGEQFDCDQTPYFTDVPSGHLAFRYIQKMYEEGMTTSYTETTFSPGDYISKDQMEAFLAKAFAHR